MIAADARVHPDSTIGGSTSIGSQSVISRGAVLGRRVTIGEDVEIGADAVIADDVVVNTGSRVEPGATVTTDVVAKSIVTGNPARTIGFVGAREWPPVGVDFPRSPGQRVEIGLETCAAIGLNDVRDARGSLLPIELTSDLPFVPRRLFFVHDVVEGGVRGQHAHRLCDQLLFAVAGAVTVVLDNGAAAAQIRLDRPDVGIYLPSGIWVTHYQFTTQSVLAVLAELPYDPAETINDYDEYLRWQTEAKG